MIEPFLTVRTRFVYESVQSMDMLRCRSLHCCINSASQSRLLRSQGQFTSRLVCLKRLSSKSTRTLFSYGRWYVFRLQYSQAKFSHVENSLILLVYCFSDMLAQMKVHNDKFMAAFANNDPEAIGPLYTEDCKVMPTGQDVIVGRKGTVNS